DPPAASDTGRGRRVAVGRTPRRLLLGTVPRVAVVHDLRALADGAREEDVALAVLHGEHGTVEPVVDRHAALAVVQVAAVLCRVVLAGRLALLAADDGVVGGELAVVDARFVDPHARAGGVLGVAGARDRVAAVAVGVLQRAVDRVGGRRDEAVAVGVDEVP